MRRYVIGDIHGGYKALMQCLERSKFDYDNDQLILIGDIADGWSQVYECVEELIKIKNLVFIRGNHDDWFIHWLTRGQHPVSWLQGGEGTLKSYARHTDREVEIFPVMGGFMSDLNFTDIPSSHQEFWRSSLISFEIDNKIFVHGGFDRTRDFYSQYNEDKMWDRNLISQAMSYLASVTKRPDLYTGPFRNYNNFDEIYIGHTSTTFWKDDNDQPIMTPVIAGNVHCLDTGGGWDGKLTIMDIDSKEFWQSDIVTELYDEKGRN